MRFYVLLFCWLFLAVITPVGYAQDVCEKFTETQIQGTIHLYKERYILKEETRGQLAILLENSVLEKLVAGLQPEAKYNITGQLHLFHSTRYLLPASFSLLLPKVKQTTKALTTEKAENKISPKSNKLTASKARKLTKKKVKIALQARKSLFGKYEITGTLQPRRIKIAEHKYYNFDFTGEVVENGSVKGEKFALVVKVRNGKKKIYESESKKFVAAQKKFQNEKGYSQVVAIYLYKSEFSESAKKFLQESGVYLATIQDFISASNTR